MKMSDKQWEACVMGLVDANHRRAKAAAEPVPAEPDQSRLSRRALNVLGGVLWTAVLALTFVACLIYAAS